MRKFSLLLPHKKSHWNFNWISFPTRFDHNNNWDSLRVVNCLFSISIGYFKAETPRKLLRNFKANKIYYTFRFLLFNNCEARRNNFFNRLWAHKIPIKNILYTQHVEFFNNRRCERKNFFYDVINLWKTVMKISFRCALKSCNIFSLNIALEGFSMS